MINNKSTVNQISHRNDNKCDEALLPAALHIDVLYFNQHQAWCWSWTLVIPMKISSRPWIPSYHYDEKSLRFVKKQTTTSNYNKLCTGVDRSTFKFDGIVYLSIKFPKSNLTETYILEYEPVLVSPVKNCFYIFQVWKPPSIIVFVGLNTRVQIDMEDFLGNCQIFLCTSSENWNKCGLRHINFPTIPLKMISIDLILDFPLTERNNKHILTTVDPFTNYSVHCVKSVPILSFSVRTLPHSDWIWRDTPYLILIGENTDQKNSKCGLFSRSVYLSDNRLQCKNSSKWFMILS